MNNPFDEITRAISAAKLANAAADENAEAMAGLLVGRLHNINGYWGRQYLVKLKRELRDFNITTKRWNK